MADILLLLALALPLVLGLLLALLGWLNRAGRLLNKSLSTVLLGWLLATGPVIIFSILLWLYLAVAAGEPIDWRVSWLPSLGLTLGFYYDGLSALFALLVAGIGAIILVYAGYYFRGTTGIWRFFSLLFLFMFFMLGLVLAGDLLTLFIFWEGTSIVSYLLIAYKVKDQGARQGAFRALLITGGGGIALLLGFILLAYVAGGTEWTTVLTQGENLRASSLYLPILLLVAAGAFTKSAQFPFHFWLPGAMSAPTPASAYLHSATMVKAGIYLMARLNPAIGQTEAWFWLLSVTGLLTMVGGAVIGLKQNDLKALLAYSTISQLGALMLIIGQDTDIAFKALAIGVLAHGLYKSSLFMVTGIVDHEAGTRDLRRLGGLGRPMPATFAVAAVAALSMAGLPPLLGFLAKETLLATATHPTLPPAAALLFPLGVVIAGAFLLAQAGMLVADTFLGQPRNWPRQPHRSPVGLLAVVAVPAFLSLAIGLLPEPELLAGLLAGAAAAAYGGPVKVSLALWTGLNIPLLLSAVAITLGVILFANRQRLRAWQESLSSGTTMDQVYRAVLRATDRAAALATQLQVGTIRTYLVVILAGLIALVVYAWTLARPLDLPPLTWPSFNFSSEVALLRLFALLTAAGAGLATVLLRRDLAAILALGALGLGVAVLMVLEPAPDVALVQILVDVLTMVILVLALTRLPRPQRLAANRLLFQQDRPQLIRDALVAAGLGLLVAAITFVALTSRPRESVATPYYAENAKALTGAKDIVGAIIVDYRALDTLIEITVFSVAGLGIYTLLRHARRQAEEEAAASPSLSHHFSTYGIGGHRTSSLIGALATIALPLAMVIGAVQILFGHDQPGDGFTAAVIIGLAIGLWYIVFGYEYTRYRLSWLKPTLLISLGLALASLAGGIGLAVAGSFLAHVDLGQMAGWNLPPGITLSTSLLFELAICLAVLGSVAHMLNTLGHREPLEVAEDKPGEATTVPAPVPSPGAPAAKNAVLSSEDSGDQFSRSTTSQEKTLWNF